MARYRITEKHTRNDANTLAYRYIDYSRERDGEVVAQEHPDDLFPADRHAPLARDLHVRPLSCGCAPRVASTVL